MYIIKIIDFEELLKIYADQWIQLFKSCFDASFSDAEQILKKKYTLNKGFVALLIHHGRLRASYSVVLDSRGDPVGLSVDTMSDGTVPSATYKLTCELYPFLEIKGLIGLYGFPNENILGIRLSKLGWEKVAEKNIYFGLLKKNKSRKSLFELKRPVGYYFRYGFLWKVLSIIRIFKIGFGFDQEVHRACRCRISKKILCRKSFSPLFVKKSTVSMLSIDVP